MSRRSVIALAVFMVGLSVRAQAQTATVAGEFSVEPPTLLSLGFDWTITGDDNRNAAVDVSYRKRGETQSKKALRAVRQVICTSAIT
jgi:hypothetical protein